VTPCKKDCEFNIKFLIFLCSRSCLLSVSTSSACSLSSKKEEGSGVWTNDTESSRESLFEAREFLPNTCGRRYAGLAID
jgi:hypothetical protein